MKFNSPLSSSSKHTLCPIRLLISVHSLKYPKSSFTHYMILINTRVTWRSSTKDKLYPFCATVHDMIWLYNLWLCIADYFQRKGHKILSLRLFPAKSVLHNVVCVFLYQLSNVCINCATSSEQNALGQQLNRIATLDALQAFIST